MMLSSEIILQLQVELEHPELRTDDHEMEIDKDLALCFAQKSFGPWYSLEAQIDQAILKFEEQNEEAFKRIEPYVDLLLASSS